MWFFFTFSGGLKQIYITLFEPWEKSSQKFLIVGVLGGGKPFSESLFHSNSAWSTFPDGEIHGVTKWSTERLYSSESKMYFDWAPPCRKLNTHWDWDSPFLGTVDGSLWRKGYF